MSLPAAAELRRDDSLKGISHSQLIEMAQSGDWEAQERLIEMYYGLVRSKARSYFLIWGERDDVIQEGLIGLLKAIRDFVPAHGASFQSFADLCITRQIITAVKSSTRLKHTLLNASVSLSKPLYDNENERSLDDVVASDAPTPEDALIDGEQVLCLRQAIDTILSSLERSALLLYLKGQSFREIADALSTREKSIDNALWRAKRKLRGHLAAEPDSGVW